MKFLEIKLERWTEQKKHDSNFGKLRAKKSMFVSKKKGFIFSAIVTWGRLSTLPRAYATGAHLPDLAPGEHRNIAAVASRWQHCAVFKGPGIEPQTFRTDSLCA